MLGTLSEMLGTTWWSILCGCAGFAVGVWSCRTWLSRFFDDY